MASNKQTIEYQRCSLAGAALCLTDDGNRQVLVALNGYQRVSIFARDVGGTAWSTAVVTVRVSNCQRGPWLALPPGSVTLTAPGLMGPIDVSPYAFLSLEVTTAQSGVAADFSICCWGTK